MVEFHPFLFEKLLHKEPTHIHPPGGQPWQLVLAQSVAPVRGRFLHGGYAARPKVSPFPKVGILVLFHFFFEVNGEDVVRVWTNEKIFKLRRLPLHIIAISHAYKLDDSGQH
ncbi:uncharacterized protein CIMG_08406 [Coccidioides immitis RS]|uniref:Uncharacterized protein n=1 Tax=Coccidioides immitis (strain RS) TaxID=246410 RepID=A0A0E1RW27_COCIM|nr:uncharacterized protein CIMG_08406 [Coccidioides immitis RS]EAS29660.1 hypothetical protein CIMG_08406 [Coccidioides immitis RS]